MNRKTMLAALAATLMSGCASVTEHLTRSLRDAYLVSEVCEVVHDVVAVQPEDIKADLQELGERLLGITTCDDTGSQCHDPLRDQLRKFENGLRALIAKAHSPRDRARYEKQIAELRASLKTVSDELAALRGDIKAALDDIKLTARGRCASADACYRDYRKFTARLIHQAANRFHDLFTIVHRIGVQMQNLANDMIADGTDVSKEFETAARSLQDLTVSVEIKISNARTIIGETEWTSRVKSFAEKVALMEAGRAIVRIVEKGLQSLDRMLDRVDEKAWFIASLSIAIYENDIRDHFKRHFRKYFTTGSGQNQVLFRKMNAAFVLAACEQLARPGDGNQGSGGAPANGRGAYLLYPLFTAAVAALYETVQPAGADGKIDLAQLDTDKFQDELEKWLSQPDTKGEIKKTFEREIVADASELLKTTQSKQQNITKKVREIINETRSPFSKHSKAADPMLASVAQPSGSWASAPMIAAKPASTRKAPASARAASEFEPRPAPTAASAPSVYVFTLTLPSADEIEKAAKKVR